MRQMRPLIRALQQAKEGAIEEGSAMWQEMSKGDQEKRSRASREKATKLRSPNFYISTTRLSLRNLPYTMDEKALKTLVVAAVRHCLSAKLSLTPRHCISPFADPIMAERNAR